MKVTDIIIEPVITEKTSKLAQNKVYAFQVHKNTNKAVIAETIEHLFGVEVAAVRIMNKEGKAKRVGRRKKTKKMPDTKVAYITLKKGNIDLFPQS